MTDVPFVQPNVRTSAQRPFNRDPLKVKERKRAVVAMSVAVGCAAGAIAAITLITLILSSVDASSPQFTWDDVRKSALLFVGVPIFTALTAIGAAASFYAPFRPSLQGVADRPELGEYDALREEARQATEFQRPIDVPPDLKQRARDAAHEYAELLA